jgi:hypothetical protein
VASPLARIPVEYDPSREQYQRVDFDPDTNVRDGAVPLLFGQTPLGNVIGVEVLEKKAPIIVDPGHQPIDGLRNLAFRVSRYFMGLEEV